MDRNKRPALTSPWKIGFLVSLLLVTLGIGVGFAITRTFGVTWSWLRFGDGQWAFNMDAFLREMLPLVVMVPVTSLIAYFVITGAVRKYRAYLDSGLDYKHLLQSLRKVDDLDEGRIKSLTDYPELRDFLLKVRNRVGEREKVLDKKESSLEAKSEQLLIADQFKAETGVLIGAINKGPDDGFTEDLTLSLPELKQIEKAIREKLLGSNAAFSMTATDVNEHVANLKVELTASTESLKQMLAELSSEMVVNQNGAKEIELYLSQLKTVTGPPADTDAAAANTITLVERLDQSSAALAALGEETRGMAINTALHAGSGEGDAQDLVKLADDVRDVAAKFNTIAAHHQEVGGQLKTAVQSMPKAGGSGEVDEVIETMSGKLKYWVERAMVLSEKLNAFERQFVDDTTTFNSKLGGESSSDSYQDVPELVVDDITTGTGAPDAGNADDTADGAFPGSAAEELALDLETTSSTSPAGAGQKKDLFEEIGGSSEDNLFADIPANDAGPSAAEQTEQPAPAEQPTADAADSATAPPSTPSVDSPSELFEEMDAASPHEAAPPVPNEDAPLAPQPSESRTEPGQFVRSQIDLSNVGVEGNSIPADEAPPADVPTQPAPPVTKSAEPEAKPVAAEQTGPNVEPSVGGAEEPIYDLYELGAVDYEPTVHQNA